MLELVGEAHVGEAAQGELVDDVDLVLGFAEPAQVVGERDAHADVVGEPHQRLEVVGGAAHGGLLYPGIETLGGALLAELDAGPQVGGEAAPVHLGEVHAHVGVDHA